MKAVEWQRQALREAVREATGSVNEYSETIVMTECQLYETVRSFMHKLDRQSGKLDPKRYGYKAVAGAMTELRKRRGCT